MTDADKKLYDKALDDLWSIASGTPEEIDAMTTPWIAGYQEGLKAKINATTISDCPHKDEWHYPAKGELPKASGNYILAFYGAEGSVASGKPCCEETFFDAELLRWKERDTYDDLPYLEKKGVVIAWRELPEPPKEEE